MQFILYIVFLNIDKNRTVQCSVEEVVYSLYIFVYSSYMFCVYLYIFVRILGLRPPVYHLCHVYSDFDTPGDRGVHLKAQNLRI